MEQLWLSFPVLFTVLSLLVFIFMMLRIGRRSSTNPNLPPGPKRIPILGNLHLMMTASLPHHRLRDLAKTYGPLMHLQLGEVPHIVVSSPEVAREVMQTHDLNFSQRPFLPSASDYFGVDVFFAPYGDYWRQMRKLCVIELLTAKRVLSFRSIREEEVAKLIEFLSSSCSSASSNNTNAPVINLTKKIFFLTYGITGRTAFGKTSLKEQEAFVANVMEGMKLAAAFTFVHAFPSQKWLHVVTGQKDKMEKNQLESDRILQNIINDHTTERANYAALPKTSTCADSKDTKEVDDDLVDVFLNLQDNADLKIPVEFKHIKAVILDIFIAGSETSSTTLEWAMSEMVKHPRVMKKVQAEVRRVCGKKGDVEEADIQELKYLKLVIKETLRLHPPGALQPPRECRETCVINGYEIPAKTRVLVNTWLIGRDPRYWSEPDKFYPERFLEGNSADFRGSSFEFIPFGAGRRMCPGIAFAMADMELPLAQMLFHFDWKLPNGVRNEDIDMTEGFGLSARRKDDLYLIPVPYKESCYLSSALLNK